MTQEFILNHKGHKDHKGKKSNTPQRFSLVSFVFKSFLEGNS